MATTPKRTLDWAPGLDGSNLKPLKRGATVTLAAPRLKGQMDKLRHDLATDPKIAHAFLLDIGIITPTGRLAKRYGG